MIGGTVTRTPGVDVGELLARFVPALLENVAEHAAGLAKDSLDYPGPQAPSNPGEAPNSQTGALYEGIGTEVDGDRSVVTSTRNGGNVVPNTLEQGRIDGTLAARPYMGPSFDQTVRDLPEIVELTKKEVGA